MTDPIAAHLADMTPYYSDDHVTLRHGDCLDVLPTLPDASVDSVVTDPPYGLANTSPEQVSDTIVRWVNGDRDYLPGGSGFMGKAWDAFVPPVAVWDECLRVLKPGGHVLAFAGPRTHDLMTLALRLAGFDIRDGIAWLYGSGFPKSLDVSKAIDKGEGHWRGRAGEMVGSNDSMSGPNYERTAKGVPRYGSSSCMGRLGDGAQARLRARRRRPQATRGHRGVQRARARHRGTQCGRVPRGCGAIRPRRRRQPTERRNHGT